MKIFDKFEIIDLGLKYKDNLIIGDLQLGYEEYLREKGALIPKFQLKDVISRLEKIFSKFKFSRVIINGDVKHEFGRINRQEWKDVLELFDFILSHVRELVLIKGNHDPILFPLAKKRDIKVLDSYEDSEVTIIHGDYVPSNLNKYIIIGHEHPAVSFREKPGEKFKCFLVGKFKRKNLIVMPSFSSLVAGSDISRSSFLGPFLKDISNFSCYLVDDSGEVRDFGKVKDLPV